MKPEPIKRHESLIHFSHDHHHGLALCRKIRQAIKNNIAPERIKTYTDWFWKSYLCNHFFEEEKYLFPILPFSNENVIKALSDHKIIQKLFEQKADKENFIELSETLEKHIRFEERILFNQIQEFANENQLREITAIHSTEFRDNLNDIFWK